MLKKRSRGCTSILLVLAMGLLDMLAPGVVSICWQSRGAAREQWAARINQVSSYHVETAPVWHVASADLSFDQNLQETAAAWAASATRL